MTMNWLKVRPILEHIQTHHCMELHLTLWDNLGPQTVSQGTHKRVQNRNLHTSADCMRQ